MKLQRFEKFNVEIYQIESLTASIEEITFSDRTDP